VQVTDETLPYNMVYQTPHGLRLRANVDGVIRNHVLSGRDIILQTDQYGLRGRALTLSKLSKILVLGDSITLADYVDEDETIPALLTRHFKDTYTFINAGVATTGTNDQFYRYLEVRDAIQPKVVLVGMFLDDSRSTHGIRIQRLPAWTHISRLGAIALSSLPRVRQRILSSEETAGEVQRFGDIHAMWAPEAWSNVRKALELLKQDTLAHDIKLGIFLFPLAEQVFEQDAMADSHPLPQKHFLDMCMEVGLPCFDLLPALKEAHSKAPDIRLYFDFCHLTLDGHHVTTEALAPWIQHEFLSDR
jgi:lysophospholipase L1-like esterase